MFHMILTYHCYHFSPISHTLGFSLLNHHHGHRSSSSLCWIMHYNIAIGAEKYFFKKKIVHYGDEDGSRIHEPVEYDDGIRFLISLSMGRVTCKYMKVWYENKECKTCPHFTPLSCLSN